MVSMPDPYGIARSIARPVLDRLGYRRDHWTRAVMYSECFRLLAPLNVSAMDAMEISGGYPWSSIQFRSFTQTSYPDFDICTDTLEATFDIIIADQVFEHVLWPYRAA